MEGKVKENLSQIVSLIDEKGNFVNSENPDGGAGIMSKKHYTERKIMYPDLIIPNEKYEYIFYTWGSGEVTNLKVFSNKEKLIEEVEDYFSSVDAEWKEEAIENNEIDYDSSALFY